MAELMVGGAFLSAVLNVLFDRLASRQIVDFFRNRKLDEKLLMRFKTALLTVNVVLDDAEAKEVTRPAVKQWHEELKHVVYQAEDVLDEIVTKASKPKTGKFNASMFDFSNKKLDANRVEDIVARMEYIASQKQFLGLHEGVKDNSIQRGQTSSLVESCVYGRDDDKQKIIKSVLMDVAVGDQIPVIAIVGMGGIGKTTLAQIVYNDEKVEDYFDIKAWVCVTEELDIFRITKIVLETVTSNHSTDITDLNLLQLKLKQMLSKKKVLLVLDDVWNEDYSKWRMLCVPFTNVSPGSKIIVTTRNDGVASIMRTLPSYSLEHLSQDDSWKLFTHHAFEARICDGYPHLEVIGKQIVEKCKGLPLAIKSLGGVLRNKDDVKVWENVMTSEIWDLATGTTSILPALRLSYHYLPTHLKRCFAYCSIFPQDYEFEKTKLVLLWMAEGFVIDNTNKSLEELGEEYFDELFARSFFQKSSGENGTFFVMHDLNNDLARDVSGEFCLTLERGKTCQLSEKVRHFLYSQNKYDDDSKLKPILNSKHMRTFLQVKQLNTQFLYISNTIIRDLLPKLSCVRVLSLSYYNNVVELPDSIFTLIHLRYLDLSHTNIRYLPNTICQLYNLQTLLLSNCRKLVKLPENLGELVNLRHLDISETSICKMPLQIRMLASLQTLSTFIVGEENCSRLGELKGFRYLKGSLSVMGLHNVKNVEDVIEANLKEKVGIEKLRFEWGRETEVSENQNDLLDNLQPCANLTQLVLEGYSGTCLSNWLGNGSLFNLAYLQINNCVNCSSLPPLGQLPSLVGLRVTGMKSIRRVGSEFYGNGPSSVKSFKKLAILKFEGMYEWEEWSSSGGSIGDYDFPELKILWIKDCPKLCGNLPKVPPSLHDLLISECGELTVIIPGDASLRSLKLEGCKNLESMSKSFPNGMMKNCNNLDQLRIGHWPSLTHFPDDGLPVTSLRIFEIEYCNKLEFLPKETFHSYKYLEKLNLFKSCDSMISFPIGLFPSLKYVEMSHCDKLRNFQTAPAPSLYSIDIMDCKSLKSLPEGMNTLEFLRISNCEELESLPEGMNNLELLRISNCEELESFPVGGLPSNLQYLIIRGCKKMMAKRREWGLHTLAFLKFLEIEGCEEVETFPEEDCRLPTSLAIIYLERLPKLKRIEASRLLKLTSLVDLGIKHCPKVKFDPKLRNTRDLPASFRQLSIINCPLLAKQLRKMRRDIIPFLQIDREFIV